MKKTYKCYRAVSGNVYVVTSSPVDGRCDVYFPFVDIHGMFGSLPTTEIEKDELVDSIESDENGKLSSMQIIALDVHTRA